MDRLERGGVVATPWFKPIAGWLDEPILFSEDDHALNIAAIPLAMPRGKPLT